MKFILVLITFSSTIFSQWIIQTSNVSIDLNDVCFIDSQYGWTVGDSSTILYTENGGDDWLLQNSPITNVNFSKISFLDKNVGYILANRNILKTTDGGINWLTLDIPPEYNLSDLCFISKEEGWLSGYYESPTDRFGAIFKTDDGGNTWQQLLDLNSTELVSGNVIIAAVQFLDALTGWLIVGGFMDNFDNVSIMKTVNGGIDWETVGETTYLCDYIRVVSQDTLWAGSFISFERSFDGGVSWEYSEDEDLNSFIDLLPLNGKFGYAISYNFISKEAGLFSTSNYGLSWDIEFAFVDSYGLSLSSYSDKYLWIVGQNGLIMKGTDVITTISEDEYISNTFILKQNYPNPFNPNTTIQYNIPPNNNNLSSVKIDIFDNLGQLVTTLVDKELREGKYQTVFNASNLPSGIYYYSLTFDSKYLVKKMIYIK